MILVKFNQKPFWLLSVSAPPTQTFQEWSWAHPHVSSWTRPRGLSGSTFHPVQRCLSALWLSRSDKYVHCFLWKLSLFYRWAHSLREVKQFALKLSGSYSKTDPDTGPSEPTGGGLTAVPVHCFHLGLRVLPWRVHCFPETPQAGMGNLWGGSSSHFAGIFFLTAFIREASFCS